jgi:N-acetylglucosaminylphosphatidylinositol deacetylase
MDSFDSRISGCPFTFLLWGIFVLIGFCAQYYLFSSRKPDDWLVQACKNRKERSAAKILFVIAHPDDECMFFGPAITSLTKPNEKKNAERKNIFLLCLSDGTG